MAKQLINEPDYEWLMIDTTHCKVHPYAAGAQGGHQGMGRTQGGSNIKIPLAVAAQGMPIRALATEGSRADCTEAAKLIEGITAEYLIADKGHNSDAIVEQA
jgi:hypothetical protein